jgi:hypothetical protein
MEGVSRLCIGPAYSRSLGGRISELAAHLEFGVTLE